MSVDDRLARVFDVQESMKQSDLRHCSRCGRGVMHSGQLTFFRLSIEHFVMMLDAIRRQHGLEIAFGALAPIFGTDPDLAKRVGARAVVFLCVDCASTMSVAELFELRHLEEKLSAPDSPRPVHGPTDPRIPDAR